MSTRNFHIGDILSITHGALVSPRHIGGVYDILGWMTGETLMTHQLPRASRECEDNLRAQVPDLLDIVIPDWSGVPKANIEATVMGWLAQMVEQYGETRAVAPLPAEDHTPIDPFAELRMMRPDAEIIAVHLPDN